MSEVLLLIALLVFLVVTLGCLRTYHNRRNRKDPREQSGRSKGQEEQHETNPSPAFSAFHKIVNGERKIAEKRRYTFRDEEFLLEPISDSVIRVTYEDQVAYVGMNVDWNPNEPYCWTELEFQVQEEGIDTSSTFEYPSIDETLERPCENMLDAQRRRDAQCINPDERKAAVRQVMREFLEELPLEEPSVSGDRTGTGVDEAA